MAEQFYGPKRLADALDCDQRTARAILAAIADVEIAPGIKRLSEEGYRAFVKKRKEVGKSETENRADGKLSRGQEAMGGPEKAPKWKAA